MSTNNQVDLQVLRQKAISGELSNDELRDAIRMLRETRLSAAKTSHKANLKKAKVNSDSLLDELEGL
jgi:hypothetical protein